MGDLALTGSLWHAVGTKNTWNECCVDYGQFVGPYHSHVIHRLSSNGDALSLTSANDGSIFIVQALNVDV